MIDLTQLTEEQLNELELQIQKHKKEQKHKHGEYNHVLLTEKQYSKLLEDWGISELERMIKKFDENIQMKGYKYKDHNLAIRKWQRNDKDKPIPIKKPAKLEEWICNHGGTGNKTRVLGKQCKICGDIKK